MSLVAFTDCLLWAVDADVQWILEYTASEFKDPLCACIKAEICYWLLGMRLGLNTASEIGVGWFADRENSKEAIYSSYDFEDKKTQQVGTREAWDGGEWGQKMAEEKNNYGIIIL